MNTNEPTLYERLGGESAIESMTKSLYERVLADNDLKQFFANTSMEKQLRMQHEFLCAALGGPMTYTGKPIEHAHHGRGIKTQHFAKFVNYLLETLRDMGVNEDDADAVISRLNAHANEITGASY